MEGEWGWGLDWAGGINESQDEWGLERSGGEYEHMNNARRTKMEVCKERRSDESRGLNMQELRWKGSRPADLCWGWKPDWEMKKDRGLMNAHSCLPRLMLSVQTPSGAEGVSLRGRKSFQCPSLRGAKQKERVEKRKLALCICFQPHIPSPQSSSSHWSGCRIHKNYHVILSDLPLMITVTRPRVLFAKCGHVLLFMLWLKISAVVVVSLMATLEATASFWLYRWKGKFQRWLKGFYALIFLNIVSM